MEGEIAPRHVWRFLFVLAKGLRQLELRPDTPRRVLVSIRFLAKGLRQRAGCPGLQAEWSRFYSLSREGSSSTDRLRADIPPGDVEVSIRFLAKGLRQLGDAPAHNWDRVEFLFAFSRRVFVNKRRPPGSQAKGVSIRFLAKGLRQRIQCGSGGYSLGFYSLSREGSSSTVPSSRRYWKVPPFLFAFSRRVFVNAVLNRLGLEYIASIRFLAKGLRQPIHLSRRTRPLGFYSLSREGSSST